jgi:hypothetical protein
MDLIVAVVDRSGSMGAIKREAEDGLNSFLKEQQKLGEARFTLAEFDTDYELLADDLLLSGFKGYSLEPAGGTALLDAIGRTASRVRDYVVDGKKIFIVVTDGEENSSKEWTKGSAIYKLIGDLRNEGWETIFIGTDEASLQQASSLGFNTRTAFAFQGAAGASSAYDMLSTYSTSLRSGSTVAAAEEELERGIVANAATLSTYADTVEKKQKHKGVTSKENK